MNLRALVGALLLTATVGAGGCGLDYDMRHAPVIQHPADGHINRKRVRAGPGLYWLEAYTKTELCFRGALFDQSLPDAGQFTVQFFTAVDPSAKPSRLLDEDLVIVMSADKRRVGVMKPPTDPVGLGPVTLQSPAPEEVWDLQVLVCFGGHRPELTRQTRFMVLTHHGAHPSEQFSPMQRAVWRFSPPLPETEATPAAR